MATFDAVRTPDDRFADIPDLPRKPQHLDSTPTYERQGISRIDEGPSGSDCALLCLHGQPSWSLIHRHKYPVFLETRAHLVGRDLFRFGRSDKPTDDAVNTFGFHRRSLIALIEEPDLRNVAMVVQDWGGLLGLTIPPDIEDVDVSRRAAA